MHDPIQKPRDSTAERDSAAELLGAGLNSSTESNQVNSPIGDALISSTDSLIKQDTSRQDQIRAAILNLSDLEGRQIYIDIQPTSARPNCDSFYLTGADDGQRYVSRLIFKADGSTSEFNRNVTELAVGENFHHASIAKIVAFHRLDDLYADLMVREYKPGKSLREYIDEKNFTAELAVAVISQMAEALAYGHNPDAHPSYPKTVLHEDIKPDNIILDFSIDDKIPSVYLIDYGVARSTDENMPYVTNTITGTKGYMPVEKLGGVTDPRSDIYSLGVSVIEALIGHLPTGLRENYDYQAPFNLTPCADIPPKLCAILNRTVHPNPAMRYQSATHLLSDLEKMGVSDDALVQIGSSVTRDSSYSFSGAVDFMPSIGIALTDNRADRVLRKRTSGKLNALLCQSSLRELRRDPPRGVSVEEAEQINLERLNSIREVDFNNTRKELLAGLRAIAERIEDPLYKISFVSYRSWKGIGGFSDRVSENLLLVMTKKEPLWHERLMFWRKDPVIASFSRILGEMDQADVRRWRRRPIDDAAEYVEYAPGEEALKFQVETNSREVWNLIQGSEAGKQFATKHFSKFARMFP